MTVSSSPAAAPVDLVLIGGDIGVYALARAFHEQYGTIATVVSRQVAGPIADSRILITREVGRSASEERIIQEVLAVGREKAAEREQAAHSGEAAASPGAEADPAHRPILLANADFLVGVIASHREELAPWFHLPVLDDEVLRAVGDKAAFAEICARAGVPTPRTVVLDFTGGARPEVPELDLGWPAVGKAARSAAYATVAFAGKRKVFELTSREEVEDLVDRLHEAGFRDRFLLQEMIPGDDTAMLSVTAYVDSSGAVTMMGGARVLLEEHTPTALGNPAAMIVEDLGEVFEQSRRLLEASAYRGYANFDVKMDPRDGVAKFFEVNPRIGRNNYYMTAAGANVAIPVVADHIEHRPLPEMRTDGSLLYSIVPRIWLARYIVDPSLRRRMRQVARRRTVHPLLYSAEGPRRRAYVIAAGLNQIKKFLQHYPRPSQDGF